MEEKKRLLEAEVNRQTEAIGAMETQYQRDLQEKRQKHEVAVALIMEKKEKWSTR